jgi:hypothetical protein
VDAYLPYLTLQRFRKLYLDEQKPAWRTLLGDDIRINIMFTKRKWYLFFFRRFIWVWSDGFTAPNAHLDSNLWLTEFQGACGQALRAKTAVHVDFRKLEPEPKWTQYVPDFVSRYFPVNQFRLWPRQLKKTSRLIAILSIPIYLPTQDDCPTWRCVGVVNLDTLSKSGGDFLSTNRKKLVAYFVQATANVARLGP